jgi:hypothetical protein
MASFKLSKKDHVTDTRSSLNELHDRKMDFFDQEHNNLNKYIIELNNLKKKPNLDSIRIVELEEKISNIQNDVDRTNYLLDFFKIIHKNGPNNSKESKKDGVLDTFINSKVDNTKIELYNEYISKFNPELKPIQIKQDNCLKCKNCGSFEFIYDQKAADEICISCGLSVNILTNDEDQVSYSDNIEQVNVFNYKRNNHFQECLNQLQAKENTTIPPKIIEDLTKEFKKYNITDPNLFTPSLVKSYLKKLKYNKYYEHIPTIINEFCGLRAPKLTSELEEQLKIMFDEIQIPFEKYSRLICPDRKNFLNYNYVLYKMCELLNKDNFLNCFPLLKNREILYQHDLIWKGICNDCKWEFIPSI